MLAHRSAAAAAEMRNEMWILWKIRSLKKLVPDKEEGGYKNTCRQNSGQKKKLCYTVYANTYKHLFIRYPAGVSVSQLWHNTRKYNIITHL